jgi:hypothetical protein
MVREAQTQRSFMVNLERWLSLAVLGRPPVRRRREQRRGPARDLRYRAFVRTKPCCCECGRWPVHTAHTGKDGGMSMKASDYSCVPLFLELPSRI